LQMAIALPNRDELLRVDLATTRWWSGGEFGVEFIQLDPEQQRRLQDCVQGLAGETIPAISAVLGP
jgi:hypothetical protein